MVTGPNIESMGLASSIDDISNSFQSNPPLEIELTFDDLDEAEIDTYIMSEDEFKCKKTLWYKINASYLEEQKGNFFRLNIPKLIKHLLEYPIRLSRLLLNNITKCI